MKHSLLYILILMLVLTGCTTKLDFTIPDAPTPTNSTSDIIISEISTAINTDPAAGSVRNHYVELYNGTNEPIDLSNYAIGYVAVTDTATLTDWSFTSSTYFILKGTLASAGCYVIASPQIDPTHVKADTTWGTTSTTAASASLPLQLSGNSAIALLEKSTSGTTYSLGGVQYKIIDVFGSPNVARSTATGSSSTRNNINWVIAGITDTRNRTFWRKSTVRNPTTDWATTKGTTTDNSQWAVSGDRAWDYTNVGSSTK